MELAGKSLNLIESLEMLIARTAVPEDIEGLLALAAQTGRGMTTMPTDRGAWEARLSANVKTFKAVSTKDGAQSDNDDSISQLGTCFLVLQDTETGKLVGSSALYSDIGLDRPFYSYKVSKVTTRSRELDLTVHMKVLLLVNDYTGCTEIGSLFLSPDYRGNSMGQFLSRSRFMLVADFRHLFNDLVFAEIRGWFDENGHSPFWEFLGRKFFGLSYDKADFINGVHGSQFISDLMPRYPIYKRLLPQAAQDVIGKPNDKAVPAVKILERENFQYTGYVDIFDAGPRMECKTDRISTVRNSQVQRVAGVSDASVSPTPPKDQLYMISNRRLENYRMALQPVEFSGDGIIINRQTADHLDLAPGDNLRFIKLIE